VTEVSQAKADGTTLLIGNINTNGLAPALHAKKYGYDVKTSTRSDHAPSDGPSALIASKTAPAVLREQLTAWRANPGKYVYFGAGPGSFGHIWFAASRSRKGPRSAVRAGQRGTEGFQLMQEGSVHYAYVPIASFIGQMRSKDIRTLFVTGPARLSEFPDVPTAREVGLSADYEINTWVGLFAPPKTQPELLKKIHSAFSAAVNKPEMATRYKEMYMLQTVSPSPEDFRKFVDSQIDAYRLIAERARIKLE
jgi:tripartite-type tricarboxylate transporter receptor subunit TctC